MAQDLPALHRRLSAWPAGQWLFSRMVCARAPYFGTIAPRITVLEAGRCEGHINDRRAVHNHLGTVHAIALCNLAELVMGLLVDAATPADMRWIPKGMEVKYRAKARGVLKAVATPAQPIASAASGYDLPVNVSVTDAAGVEVFQATIAMWVSPRKS